MQKDQLYIDIITKFVSYIQQTKKNRFAGFCWGGLLIIIALTRRCILLYTFDLLFVDSDYENKSGA